MEEGFEKSQRERFDPTHASLILRDDLTEERKINQGTRDSLKVMLDKDGRRFYEIDSHPRDQIFLSRLLKGVIPVSDVVYDKKTKKFYSYEIPLERVSEGNPLPYNDDRIAQVRILGWIFNDYDHTTWGTNMNSTNNKHVFYDFEFFKHFWDEVDWKPVRRLVQHGVEGVVKELFKHSQPLKARFDSEEGFSFIRSIVEDIEQRTGEVPEVIASKGTKDQGTVLFHKELVQRLNTFEEILSERLRSSAA